MGLFGSLFTGVSALASQAQNTSIISNNIANVNTSGFKRAEASFFSLVTTESRLSRYSPGTVSVNRIQRVSQQGALQQTSSGTDAAISGNGFFPVKRSTDSSQPFLYTRAGQFSEDATGLLRNAAGFALYAWPLDAAGNLPANQGDLASLVPANVAFLGGLTRPTSLVDLAFNLNADQADQPRVDYTVASDGLLANGPAHFSRGITVYDSLGSAQDISIEFRHILSATALSQSNVTPILARDTDLGLAFPGVTDGEAFTMQVGTTTKTYEYDNNAAVAHVGATGFQTVGDLVDAINADFTFPDAAEARINENGELIIEVVDRANTLNMDDLVGGNILAGANLNMSGANGAALTAPTLPYGNTATTSSADDDHPFPDIANTAQANTQGWWEVIVRDPSGTELTRGVVNFYGDGTLNAAIDTAGDTDIQLEGINWGNGSDPQDISIDVSRFSQFAGDFDVIFSDQNGAELGLRTGVELTRDGLVVARFSNGASANLYKIPLVTFANSNGLTEVSGTAYSESEESGEENLREAGSGSAGFVEPATLEASNVDLADEFAKLIVAQRAFGAGTRVITTVDQMTEDLLRLR